MNSKLSTKIFTHRCNDFNMPYLNRKIKMTSILNELLGKHGFYAELFIPMYIHNYLCLDIFCLQFKFVESTVSSTILKAVTLKCGLK